ncbi:MAG: hypothetical protein EBR58_06820, partial [Betaproteobacteria bacterium]|nr:hypothetical protein [Betaproteobacteria bacterium]
MLQAEQGFKPGRQLRRAPCHQAGQHHTQHKERQQGHAGRLARGVAQRKEVVDAAIPQAVQQGQPHHATQGRKVLVRVDAQHAIEQHKQRRHGPTHRPQGQGLQHAAAGAVGVVKQHGLPDQAVVALGKQGRIRGQQRHAGQWHHQVGIAGVFGHEAGQHPAQHQHA